MNRVHTEISHWTVDKADVRLYGLGDRADLVHFEQQAVAGSLLSSFLYSLGVGHRQVIPNNLDPHLGRQARPGLPVILVKRVLDGHHWKWKRRGLLLINGGVLVLTSDLIIITNNVIFQITQHKSLKLLDNFKISSFKWYKGNSFSCPELRF